MAHFFKEKKRPYTTQRKSIQSMDHFPQSTMVSMNLGAKQNVISITQIKSLKNKHTVYAVLGVTHYKVTSHSTLLLVVTSKVTHNSSHLSD